MKTHNILSVLAGSSSKLGYPSPPRSYDFGKAASPTQARAVSNTTEEYFKHTLGHANVVVRGVEKFKAEHVVTGAYLKGDQFYWVTPSTYPRTKTRTYEREEFETIKRIIEKCSFNVARGTKTARVSEAPTEYVPSDDLVNLVRESMEKDQLSRAHGSVSDGGELRKQYAMNEALRKQIAEAVTEFLATVGRGLARGENKTFSLTKGGDLSEAVLKAFVFRIPVGMRYLSSFSKYLYSDLLRFAPYKVLDNQYAKITVADQELILSRIKTIQKRPPSDWKRATVFAPE